ncbi:ribokinase, partial [Burkholderia pseudomallei]|nr:ribokinase [Burkholderia pseudomallei]
YVGCCDIVARDTTGAGAAYIVCFARHYVATAAIPAAMPLALASAAHSVTGPGTQDSYADAALFELFLHTIVFRA